MDGADPTHSGVDINMDQLPLPANPDYQVRQENSRNNKPQSKTNITHSNDLHGEQVLEFDEAIVRNGKVQINEFVK